MTYRQVLKLVGSECWKWCLTTWHAKRLLHHARHIKLHAKGYTTHRDALLKLVEE